MKLKNHLTPYPVLTQDGDDYIDSFFDAFIEKKIEFGKLTLNVQFILNNNELQEKINNSQAIFAVHVECPTLCLRSLAYGEGTCSLKIDLNDIANTVEISTFIVANTDIRDYSNDKFNWEYGENVFQIAKGNILAIGPTFSVPVDKNKDGLKKLTDIIAIKQHDSNNVQETTVGIEQDIIYIYVTKEIKDLYFLHGRNYLNTVISMMLVPSIVYVLSQMSNNGEIYKEFKWYSIIEKLLQQNGIEVDNLDSTSATGNNSIYVLAQKIFKTPLEKGLKELTLKAEIS